MKDKLAQLFVFAAVYFTLTPIAGATLPPPSTFPQQEKPGSAGGTARPSSSNPIGSEAGSSNRAGSDAGSSQAAPGDHGGYSKPSGKHYKRSELKEDPIIVLNSGDEQDLKRILGLSSKDAQLIIANGPYEDMSAVRKILSTKSYQQLVSRIKKNQAAN